MAKNVAEVLGRNEGQSLLDLGMLKVADSE
jgi:hypothetical protein